MKSVGDETSSALLMGDSTPQPKHVQAKVPMEHGSFEELDIIDIMAFLWHARHYIMSGMLMGTLLGLTYSWTRKHPDPVTADPAALHPVVSEPIILNYRNEFLLLGKNDPLDNKSQDRINRITELFAQPKVLRIFFESITKKWPEVAPMWTGNEPQVLSGTFEGFLAKNRAENLIALSASATPQNIQLRLTLKLPMSVDAEQLTKVMADIISKVNSAVIIPADRKTTTTHQITMEQIQLFKVELIKQKSQLNKLYYRLLKLSESGPAVSEYPVTVESRLPPDVISFERVLALVGKLMTEDLIDDEKETQYYRELAAIQTRLEDIPKQIAAKSILLNQVLLYPISLDLSHEHGSLVRNGETLAPKVEAPQSQGQDAVSVRPVSPIRSPGFFVVIGLMFGSFLGLFVAAIKFFLEKNWDLIKARVHA